MLSCLVALNCLVASVERQINYNELIIVIQCRNVTCLMLEIENGQDEQIFNAWTSNELTK